MKVIVTGATGHLGAVLVRRLLEAGHEVRAGVYDNATALDGLAVERVSLDVRDPASVRAALRGQEVVFHLAALISLRPRDEALMRAINVEGVRNVAAAALAEGTRRMIHVSSVHAYETMRLGRPLSEDGGPATDPRCPPYDRSKAAGEAALREYIARGLDAVILNPVGMLGPWDHRPSLLGGYLRTIYRWGLPVVPGGGFCWVDVRDVADAAIAAIAQGKTGSNYLLSAGHRSNREIYDAVVTHRKRALPAVELPVHWLNRVHRGAANVRMSRFVPSQVSEAAIYTLATELTVDSARARLDLGFAPRSPEEAIAGMIGWSRERGVFR